MIQKIDTALGTDSVWLSEEMMQFKGVKMLMVEGVQLLRSAPG